jgi:hypothetical protein
MKLQTVTLCLASILALTLYAGQKSASPKADGAATPSTAAKAQAITYCCGNHTPSTDPPGPHCGSRKAMVEFEKKYHCNKWKIEEPSN